MGGWVGEWDVDVPCTGFGGGSLAPPPAAGRQSMGLFLPLLVRILSWVSWVWVGGWVGGWRRNVWVGQYRSGVE